MELVDLIGSTFTKKRHGMVENVTLEEVRRDKVKVKDLKSGNCSVLPIAKFQKFYEKQSL